MSEAQDLSTSARDAAAAVDAHIVPATLETGDRMVLPTVALSADEFAALVTATRPPAIYLLEATLDVDVEVASALEGHGFEEDEPAARKVRRAAERLAPHQDALARVFAEAVVGGVYHLAYAAADWIVAFENEVDAIATRAADEQAARDQGVRSAASRHVRDLAKQLTADPAFNSGRVSFAKRRFLAGELFPDEGERTLDALVELAENMHWLASARA